MLNDMMIKRKVELSWDNIRQILFLLSYWRLWFDVHGWSSYLQQYSSFLLSTHSHLWVRWLWLHEYIQPCLTWSSDTNNSSPAWSRRNIFGFINWKVEPLYRVITLSIEISYYTVIFKICILAEIEATISVYIMAKSKEKEKLKYKLSKKISPQF